MAMRRATAAITRLLGSWGAWFGGVLGLPIAIFGLLSFWTGDFTMLERVLMLVGGIFIFALGRILRYVCQRAASAS